MNRRSWITIILIFYKVPFVYNNPVVGFRMYLYLYLYLFVCLFKIRRTRFSTFASAAITAFKPKYSDTFNYIFDRFVCVLRCSGRIGRRLKATNFNGFYNNIAGYLLDILYYRDCVSKRQIPRLFAIVIVFFLFFFCKARQVNDKVNLLFGQLSYQVKI